MNKIRIGQFPPEPNYDVFNVNSDQFAEQGFRCSIYSDYYIISNDNYNKHYTLGPAEVYYAGYYKGLMAYWVKGQIHRVRGPAIIRQDGAKEWYKNNKVHRFNAPAMIHADSTTSFYHYGKNIK